MNWPEILVTTVESSQEMMDRAITRLRQDGMVARLTRAIHDAGEAALIRRVERLEMALRHYEAQWCLGPFGERIYIGGVAREALKEEIDSVGSEQRRTVISVMSPQRKP